MLKKDDIKNIDLLVAKKEIKERFEKILTDLRKTVERNGHAVQTIERFRGCLENPENSSVSRLPFYAPTSFSHKHSKIDCVLCVISWAIQEYYSFCAGNRNVEKLLIASLDKLENYTVKGLILFKIAGTKYPHGFYLVEIKSNAVY